MNLAQTSLVGITVKIGLVALGLSLVAIVGYSLMASPGVEPVDPNNSGTIAEDDPGPATTPATEDSTENGTGENIEDGTGENFELVGHAPILDDYSYVADEPRGIPRGSNGEITAAGDCVYVGSFSGNQPPVIVDVSDPTEPQVVGPVPDAVPGVANGIEGIAANGGVLAIDHRDPHGETAVEVPDGLPERGMSVWDISDNCREPELVARFDHGDLEVHALRLWRDPANPDRLLAVQSFIDTPNLRILDLTGCPDPEACDPEVVAEWSLKNQTGLGSTTHEAIMSTDGRRIYVAQPMAGFLQLDSSNLLESLRGNGSCDPAPPDEMPGDDHCLTVLDPNVESSLEAQSIQDGWHHTLQAVPGRPYMLALSESSGPGGADPANPNHYAGCPGGEMQVFSIVDAEAESGSNGRNETIGALHPEPVGTYTIPEQRPENCGSEGWNPDEVTWPGWMTPHFALPFPDIAFATYYSGGLRAIDISDPTNPVQVGYYRNTPVQEVRWPSYGSPGGEYKPYPFAFSYPMTHDGYVIYGDVSSGLYVLEYTGPHADQIPEEGNCLAANPGAVEPGFEPCPPYGEGNESWPDDDQTGDTTADAFRSD